MREWIERYHILDLYKYFGFIPERLFRAPLDEQIQAINVHGSNMMDTALENRHRIMSLFILRYMYEENLAKITPIQSILQPNVIWRYDPSLALIIQRIRQQHTLSINFGQD